MDQVARKASRHRRFDRHPSEAICLLNFLGDDCSKANATELRLAYNISEQLRKYLGGDAHLFANILQSAVELKYNSTNLQGVHITNGVESLGWVGCVHNLTADGTTHLEVDATYAAPLAGQKPYSKDFKSPVVFTINIVLYQGMMLVSSVT